MKPLSVSFNMSSRTFRRRIYHSLADLRSDFGYVSGRRTMLRQAMRELISPGFRERLMLVVTEVNGCRFCTFVHAREALKSGVSPADLRGLLAGQIPADTPPDEYLALTYAQHWAETDARPSPEAVQKLVETYGEERAAAIDVLLRMIRVSNLLGNTADYVLYRLTFGLLGLRKDESRFSSSED
jgi:AhpD family alkylhydroperoxidase